MIPIAMQIAERQQLLKIRNVELIYLFYQFRKYVNSDTVQIKIPKSIKSVLYLSMCMLVAPLCYMFFKDVIFCLSDFLGMYVSEFKF